MSRLPGCLLAFILVSCNAFAQEFPVSDVAYVPEARPAEAPALATAHGVFLAASGHYLGYSSEDFAAPIGADGHLLLPTRIPIDGTVGPAPAVASDGQNYLGVSGYLGGTMGSRIDANGNLLDATPFAIHGFTRGMSSSHDLGNFQRAVAWDGERYVVISSLEFFQSGTSGTTFKTQLIASIVRPDGAVVANDIVLADTGGQVKVAAHNGISVVTWTDYQGVWVRSLNSANVAGDAILLGSALTDSVSIASGDDGFLVVWNYGDVQARHLDPSGNPDQPSFHVSPFPGSPAVVWSGHSYLVAWSFVTPPFTRGPSDIDAIHVNSFGTVDENPFVITATAFDETNPALSWNGQVTCVAYLSSQHAVARIIDGETAGDEFPIEVTAAQQSTPYAAAGSFIGVAWSEFGQPLRFGRITWSGTRLDGAGIAIPGSASSPLVSLVSVTYLRPIYLVVWSDGFSLQATRINADGRFIDTEPLTISSTGCVSRIQVLSADNSFLVLWWDSCKDTTFAASVPLGGQQIPSPVPIAQQAATSIEGAWNGSVFLVAFLGFYGEPARGVIITPALKVIPLGATVIDGTDLPSSMSVASNGHDFLLVWESTIAIRARRITASGDIGEVKLVAYSDSEPSPAYAIPGATLYRIIWSTRNTKATAFVEATIDLQGNRIAPVELLALADPNTSYVDAVRTESGAAPAVVYSRPVSGPEFSTVPRVFVRLLGARQRAASKRTAHG